VEDRDVMQEAIQDKKQSIKQIEEKLNFILSMNNELTTLKDTYKKLKYNFIYIDCYMNIKN